MILEVHTSTVRRWCARGYLKFYFTPGGDRRIDFDDCLRLRESYSEQRP
jgi:excisionase family DNA binding protein